MTAASAHAVSTTATPVHHGVLRIAKGRGRVDKSNGVAEVSVRRWTLVLSPSSDGIFPADEPIVIAVGDDNFRLEAGMLRAKNARTFSYKAPRKPALARGVRSITIKRRGDGAYSITFKVRGVQLFDLSRRAPLCLPTALIVGDDDGFAGVTYDSPGSPPLVSRRVIVGPSTCPTDTWPWT